MHPLLQVLMLLLLHNLRRPLVHALRDAVLMHSPVLQAHSSLLLC